MVVMVVVVVAIVMMVIVVVTLVMMLKVATMVVLDNTGELCFTGGGAPAHGHPRPVLGPARVVP